MNFSNGRAGYYLQTILFLALCLAATVTVQAQVSPVGAYLQLRAETSTGDASDQDYRDASDGAVLNPISASVFAQADQLESDGSIASTTAQSTASSTWSSPAAGVFSLDTLLSSDQLENSSGTYARTGSLGLFYGFSVATPSELTVNYNIIYAGSSWTYYCLMPFFQLSDAGGFISQQTFGIPSSGTFYYALQPGPTYTIELADNSNLSNFSEFSSEMNGTYSFQITGIPEPETGILYGVTMVMVWIFGRNFLRGAGGAKP